MGCRMEAREVTNPKIANYKVPLIIKLATESIITWIFIRKGN